MIDKRPPAKQFQQRYPQPSRSHLTGVSVPIFMNDMSNGETLPDRGAWRNLLEEFRALGGVAENIVLRSSSNGRGLFPENMEEPVRLRIPENLLFRPRDITFRGDSIHITEAVTLGQREREFFDRYHAELSWGGGGCKEGATLIDMFNALQPELKKRLISDFGMATFIEGEQRERILRLFLRSRVIGHREEARLAPFLDLGRRGSTGLGAKSSPNGGAQIQGQVEGEILLAYEYHDPIGTFRKYGLAVPRPQAFSLPMHTKAGAFELVIGRNTAADTRHADFPAPQMRVESGTVYLSYLTLGDAKFPRMPRAIFYALMREARVGRAEDIFDQILFINRAKCLALLESLELQCGELPSRLRSMAHFQLSTLAECTGARKL